ncbi:MAG: DR2241 family protein [Chthoniobacteraceae bacterium]
MRDLTRTLVDWLAAGGNRIGQVIIRPGAGFELRHELDSDRDDLVAHTSAEAARHLANFDDAGNFRPLKTAPTLARGWRLTLPDAAQLRRALDYFYPAMSGCAASFSRGELAAVPLRGTLARQTGMYRVTQQIADVQARATIERFCADCLKQRLWEIDAPNPQPPRIVPRELPLLCHEACNLLVAEMRRVVKEQ